MGVYNKTQLKSRVASFFPDNTSKLISPSDLREIMDDVIDSYDDVGSEIIGVGTAGKIVKWTDTDEIADSIMAESGSVVTVTGSFNSTALTASRVLISDALKNIVSTTVTASEIAYVSGVTSPIQTQLNGKEPVITILPVSKGGTGVSTVYDAGSIVFIGVGGIYSSNDEQLFWDNDSEILIIGGASSAAKLNVKSGGDDIAIFTNISDGEVFKVDVDGVVSFGAEFVFTPNSNLTIDGVLVGINIAPTVPLQVRGDATNIATFEDSVGTPVAEFYSDGRVYFGGNFGYDPNASTFLVIADFVGFGAVDGNNRLSVKGVGGIYDIAAFYDSNDVSVLAIYESGIVNFGVNFQYDPTLGLSILNAMALAVGAGIETAKFSVTGSIAGNIISVLDDSEVSVFNISSTGIVNFGSEIVYTPTEELISLISIAIDNSAAGLILKSSDDNHYYEYTSGVAGALVITDLGTSL